MNDLDALEFQVGLGIDFGRGWNPFILLFEWNSFTGCQRRAIIMCYS